MITSRASLRGGEEDIGQGKALADLPQPLVSPCTDTYCRQVVQEKGRRGKEKRGGKEEDAGGGVWEVDEEEENDEEKNGSGHNVFFYVCVRVPWFMR